MTVSAIISPSSTSLPTTAPARCRAGDDAADVRWVPPADLSQYTLNPATREMIERALERLKVEG